ncbi:uncharacterized protein N7479_002819, partial [Penicillium vulpinum]|uniref:uncharacterized protein n=1 Tax=Penicillium vulpinum TaxID=29845 RepID=UPI002546A210
FSINHSNGRAVTWLHLPWSSGDDFRLSLIPISAGDRGSIPRGRDFFLHLFCPSWYYVFSFLLAHSVKFFMAGWPNGKALDYDFMESRDCRFDPCVGHFFFAF